MPPVVFLAPTFQAARRAAARRFPANTEEVVILALTPAVSQSWRKALRAENQAIWQPRFFALDDWFLEAATLSTEKQWATSADRRFFLRAILPDLRAQLKVLHRLSGSNDLVRQLDGLIADLRHAHQENFQFGGDWGEDLQLIIEEYNRRLSEANATDIENAPRIWAENFALHQNENIRDATIVFDQIIAPSPSQWRGILELAAREGSTLVTLVAPWVERADHWDEINAQVAGTALENICALWQSCGAQIEFVEAKISSSRRNAIGALLDHRAALAPEGVTLTAAHNARDEARRIADHMRAGIENLAELENVILVLPDAARYAPLLESEFPAHGLPYKVKPARPHSSYQVVKGVLPLLALGGGEWTLNAITDLFGDGMLRLCCFENQSQHSLDIHRLHKACLTANLDTLRDHEDCLQRLRNSQKVWDAALENDLRCIQNLRAAGEKISRARVATSWRDAVFEMFDLTLSHLWDEVQTHHVNARSQITALMRAIENVAARAEIWPENESQNSALRDADFWLDCLRLELESATIPLNGEEENGVSLSVAGPFSLLHHVPRVVYFAGLSEGAWPAPGVSGTLLSRHRNELAPLSAHRPDAMQMALYQLALCLGEADAIHLLHPQSDDGRERLRSPLLEDIAICWGELPQLPRCEIPTSRAQFLETLGAYFQAENSELVGTQLSQSLRDALLETSTDAAHLQTLLRISRERNSDQMIGIYDGALGARGADLMQTLHGGWRKLSATSLRTYARCPLRAWFKTVLRLEPGATHEDDFSALDTGSLVHKIVERFARECPVSLTQQNAGEAWFVMQKIARYEVGILPQRPILQEAELRRLIGNDSKIPGGQMGKMLVAEIEQHENLMTLPAFAKPLLPLDEIEKQMPPILGDGIEVEWNYQIARENPIHLTGKMDRILSSSDGEILAVIDFKTSAPANLPTFNDVNWGLDFQLPLYLLATRSLLRAWHSTSEGSTPFPRLAASFFALRQSRWQNALGETATLGRRPTKSGPGKQKSQANSEEFEPEIFHAWLDAAENRLAWIGDLLAGAQWNLSFLEAEDAGCNYCDFRTLCRRDDALAARRLKVAHEKFVAGQQDVYLPRPLLRDAKQDRL